MKKSDEKLKTEDLELKFVVSDSDSELVEKLNKIIEKELEKE